AVLLEKSRLTAGSTWHAAGLLVSFARSANIGRMAGGTIGIYKDVEKRLGYSCGLRQGGTLPGANTQHRWGEFASGIGTPDAPGVPGKLVRSAEVRELAPLLSPHQTILGGLFHPDDGYINPSDITMGMAKLAQEMGATIRQNTAALGYKQLPDRGWVVSTSEGDIRCEHLVFATGNYARENA